MLPEYYVLYKQKMHLCCLMFSHIEYQLKTEVRIKAGTGPI